MHVCVCMSLSVGMYKGVQVCGPLRPAVSDPLELELKAVVSYLMWVLGIEPGSSGRAKSALNH